MIKSSVLRVDDWLELRAAHESAVDALTAAHLERRRHGIPHPIIDFLFTYYRSSVGQLRTWHPGAGVILEFPNGRRNVSACLPLPRFYRRAENPETSGFEVDVEAVRAAKGKRWQRAATLLAATLTRRPRLSCFGLHEWAMVYGLDADEVRHAQVPLRVSPQQIASQVDSGVRCTHFDAFRFFTPAAEPLNDQRLSRTEQLDLEQPGCVHAGMDLYRWASELGPVCPAPLRLETFRAAVRARIVDMQASPYDLRDYGYAPIPVETPAGRAEYVEFQRTWVQETNALRKQLLSVYADVGVFPDGRRQQESDE